MIKFLLLILIYFFTYRANAVWELPNTPMTGIGDAGSFYLSQESITLNIFNNDYLGNTDKLMTASGMLLIYLQPTNKNHGWEFSIQRRLITPIIRTKSGEAPYDPPKGVYADQLESRLGYSYTHGHFKFEAGFSGEYYAGLGGSNITEFIHQVIGAHDDSDKYGQKVDNNYFSGSLGFGFLTQHALLMIYAHDSPVMREAFARLNIKFSGNIFQLGLQAEGVRQFQSDFYQDDIEDYRYGYGMGIKIGWYQLSANYVSPYLKYDKYGQYFISPIILSYEF